MQRGKNCVRNSAIFAGRGAREWNADSASADFPSRPITKRCACYRQIEDDMLRTAAAIFASTLVVAAAFGDTPRYAATALPVPRSSVYGGVDRVSDTGTVFGSFETLDSGQSYAYLAEWTTDSLKILRNQSDGLFTAEGVNSQGVFSGTSAQGAVIFDGAGFHPLAPSPYAAVDAELHAWSINARGDVVGWWRPVGVENSSGILWTNSAAQALENFLPVRINDEQQIAGSLYHDDGSQTAAIWQGGRVRDLGVEPVRGINTGAALEVNARGEAICTGVTLAAPGSAASFVHHSFVWRDGAYLELPPLNDSGAGALALGMNDFGDIVGEANGSAVLWRDGTVYDLNSIVTNNLGIHLDSARDINNLGQVVGIGSSNGEIHAFLLDPVDVPEPSMFLSVLLGMNALRRPRTPSFWTAGGRVG
jgi:hypothetical protein